MYDEFIVRNFHCMMCMRVNPGGQLDPDDVVGRDEFIARLWETLEVQGLVLTAERRMGKTCVVKKMAAQARSGFLCLYRDVEDVRTPLEFATRVVEDLRPSLELTSAVGLRLRGLWSHLSGVELEAAGAALRVPEVHATQWRSLLEHAVAAGLESVGDKRLVLIWDEFPYFIQCLAASGSPSLAVEVLDTLRRSRQMNPRLRIIFTGSISLHAVLDNLRRAGHAHAPLNDVASVELPRLERVHSEDLARRLLAGFRAQSPETTGLAQQIAEVADDVPFYVHHLVKAVRDSCGSQEKVSIDKIVEEHLVAAQDPWQLGHFRNRIDEHYGSDRDAALALLDAACAWDPPGEPFERLLNLARHRIVDLDVERGRALVKLLERDHYLQRSKSGQLAFRHVLVRKWWAVQRGVAR